MKKSSNCTENSTIGLLMVALIDVPLNLRRFSQVFSSPSESLCDVEGFPMPGGTALSWEKTEDMDPSASWCLG